MSLRKVQVVPKFLDYNTDKKEVTEFLIKNSSYLIYQDKQEVNEATTTEIFYGELPANKSYDDKQIIGFYEAHVLICIVDVLKNYPRKNTWVIGLMLLDEEKRGQSIGKTIYQKIEHFMLENGVETIRLGVLEDNEIGNSFWKKNGFIKNGAVKLHFDDRKIFVCEKPISGGK